MSDIAHFWPMPWRYEAEGYNSGPCIKDANGQVIMAIFWPHHPQDETALVEKAMDDLGGAIAAGGARSRVEEQAIGRPKPQ